jgi:hypothetical protein
MCRLYNEIKMGSSGQIRSAKEWHHCKGLGQVTQVINRYKFNVFNFELKFLSEFQVPSQLIQNASNPLILEECMCANRSLSHQPV